MDLNTMLLPEKVVTFDFPGCEGLTFDLAFLSKESNQALYQKCVKNKFNTRTRQAEEEFDADRFLELYTAAVVKGWKGFKLEYLKQFVLVDTDSKQDSDELEYTETNALALMKNSVTFDNWISEVMNDITNFTKSKSKKKLKESKDT